jgi:hypothetical protein
VLLSVALLAFAAPGHANGRFPLAQRLFQQGEDDQRLMLSATFGLLVTADRGANWFHLCESSFAFGMAEGDALLEQLPNNTLLAGIYSSLNASSDCGCTWQAVAAKSDDETIIDIARSGRDDVVALIVTAGAWLPPAPPEPSIFSVDFSADSGKTWRKLSNLPPEVTDALTLDVAPSDPSRIYVSAIGSGSGKLLVSEDGGTSWQSRDIAGSDLANQPYIAAVDPSDADRVFVRTNGWVEDENGGQLANDALLVTANAGSDWAEPIRRAGKLFGFSLDASGDGVVVGFGDPVQAARSTRAEELGIYRATSDRLEFEQVVTGSVSCLRWSGQGLYACFDAKHVDLGTGFALGFAENAAFDSLRGPPVAAAELFTGLLRLEDVRGPLACNAQQCLSDWQDGSGEQPAVCERLGADCDADTSGNMLECAPAVPIHEGGSGGSGDMSPGGSDQGGLPEEHGSGGVPVGGAASAMSGSPSVGASVGRAGGDSVTSAADPGCACRLAPAAPAGWHNALTLWCSALLLGASTWVRRRLQS